MIAACWLTLTSYASPFNNRVSLRADYIAFMEDQSLTCSRPNRTLVLLTNGNWACVEEFLVEIEQQIKEKCK